MTGHYTVTDVTYLRLNLWEILPVLHPPRNIWNGWKCDPHPASCCPSLTLTGPGTHSCSRARVDGCSHQTVPAGRVCTGQRCIWRQQCSHIQRQQREQTEGTEWNHGKIQKCKLVLTQDSRTKASFLLSLSISASSGGKCLPAFL